MKTRYIVSAIIQNEDKILLGKKAKGRPPYPDVWHLPGGGIEDQILGKNLWDTRDYNNPYLHYEVAREVMEEVGIKIKNIRCIVPEFFSKPREDTAENKHAEMTHYFFLEYICDYDSGEVMPSSDLAHAKWVERNELQSISLVERETALLRQLGWK